MMRIGIDVGGTNTDAVLIAGRPRASQREDPDDRRCDRGHPQRRCRSAGSGTSPARRHRRRHDRHHAFHQCRRPAPRPQHRSPRSASACRPAPRCEPFVDWPHDLRRAGARRRRPWCDGGHEVRRPADRAARRGGLRDAARRSADAGLTRRGVSSVFSPLTAECETTAAAIIADECPDDRVTLSHDLGRIGLLERENVDPAQRLPAGSGAADRPRPSPTPCADSGIAAPST